MVDIKTPKPQFGNFGAHLLRRGGSRGQGRRAEALLGGLWGERRRCRIGNRGSGDANGGRERKRRSSTRNHATTTTTTILLLVVVVVVVVVVAAVIVEAVGA